MYKTKILLSTPQRAGDIEFDEQVDNEVDELYKGWTSDVENLKIYPCKWRVGYGGIDTKHIKYGWKMMVTKPTQVSNTAPEQAIFQNVSSLDY